MKSGKNILHNFAYLLLSTKVYTDDGQDWQNVLESCNIIKYVFMKYMCSLYQIFKIKFKILEITVEIWASRCLQFCLKTQVKILLSRQICCS
jgi:hypothetical protein